MDKRINSALDGLRVLDLSEERGMFCAKLLADMGADVVKVEPPGGDRSRETGPFFKDIPHPNRSLYFWYNNTSKRGITLNLLNSRGQDIFRKLAVTADIVVESYPPGFLGKLGLGYKLLREINPGIILTSITDFGQTGPWKDYKSSDIVTSALSGQMYVCGDRDTLPLKPYGEQVYLTSSIFAAIGTLLAIRFRRFSSKGQHVDISIHECAAGVIEQVNVRYLYDQIIAVRQGSLQWNNASRLFPCQDGYILLTLFQQWETLIEWMDSEGLAGDLTDEKWRNPQVRQGGLDYIIQVLEHWTGTHTVAELVEQGQMMHFPWAEASSIDRLCGNAQLIDRKFFIEVVHPELKTYFNYPGFSYKLSRLPYKRMRRAPLVGEHNWQVYGEELGLSEKDLTNLESKSVI